MPPERLIRNLVLAACSLVFILLAVFVVQRPRSSAAPFTQDIDAVEQINLQVSTQTLTLSLSSTTWSVEAPGQGPYRADGEKVKTLLTGLKSVEVEDVISEHGTRATDFDIHPGSAAVVQLFGKNKSPLGTGLFGKPADNLTHLYFRYPDKPTVYLARGPAHGDQGEIRVSAWRDHTLLTVTEDYVLTLVLEGPGFKTVLVRSSDTWTLNGKIVEPGPVWGLLGTLAHLRADDFLESSAPAPSLTYGTAILQLKDATTHTVRVGRPDPITHRYPVAVDNDPHIAWVSEMMIKSFLRKPNEFKPAASSSPAASSRGTIPGFPANNRGE